MKRRPFWCAMALVAAALAFLLLGLLVGSSGLEAVWLSNLDGAARQIVLDIRLPRTLGAWATGALLGLAGAVAQGLFRNPLADPFLLGSASGASLGVALALAFFSSAELGDLGLGNAWLTQLGLTGAGFLGAVLGVVLTLVLAKGVQHTLRLLLAGVVVGVVLGAVKDLVALSAPTILQGMQAFALGSTGFIGWGACAVLLSVLLPCLALAWGLSRVLDGLVLGEATARSLGLALGPMRAALVGVLALATGTAVAQAGLIAFVGLAAPHLARALVKSTHNHLLVLSSLMGGVLLMAADILARWLIAPQELPVGVMTAVLGGSYLLWLMHRHRPGALVP